MEQEPGKAGEPVPAAPHPDDVPTFEPKIGPDPVLENGSSHSETAPVSISAPEIQADAAEIAFSPAPTPFEPSFPATTDPLEAERPAAETVSARPSAEAAPPLSLAGPGEPAAPAPPAPVSTSFLESEPSEPEPVLHTAEWTSPADVSAVSEEPAAIRTIGDPGAAEAEEAEVAATETAEIPAVPGMSFAAQPPPPPPVLSAWGPPPPAWPPAATSAPTGEGVLPGAAGVLPAAGEPLPAVQPVEEPYVETGPNWMLAFVCLWAAGTALNEAWFLAVQVGLTPALLRNVTVMGYGVLGLGLIGFALDALASGKKQSPAASIVKALIPALLTLAGVILLVLSNDPGRRI